MEATAAPPKQITARARCRMINKGRHKDEAVFSFLDSDYADHGELRIGITNEALREAIEVDTLVELELHPLQSATRKIQGTGVVKIQGQRFGSPELSGRAGDKVDVAFDPEDMSGVHVIIDGKRVTARPLDTAGA